MLKRFLLNILSSFVGAWLAILMSLAVVVVGFIGLVGRFAESSSFAGVKHGSVLKISLDGEIEETDKPGEPDYASLIQGTIDRPQALDVIVQSIREGAANKDISAPPA